MVSASFPNRPFNLRDSVWLIGQEIGNNRSLVGFELWIDKRSYSPTFSGGKAHRWMRLNGGFVHEYYGNGFDFRNGNNFLLASGQAWIPHNADGTKSLLIEAAADFDILGATSLSVTIGLPTIPRASYSSIAPPFTRDIGSSVTINTNRASAGFTHTLYYAFAGSGWQLISGGVGASINWTPPLTLIDDIPNATTGVVDILTYTYNGGTLIGSTVVSFTLKVPDSYVPDFTTILHTEATAGVASNVGKYVQGVSTLALELTGAVGVEGSTITSRKIEVISSLGIVTQVINAGTGTSTPIQASGTVTLRGTVVDSRGRSKQKTVDINVLPYSPPLLNMVSIERALIDGTVDIDEGTYLRININAQATSLINTTERNSLGYRIWTKNYGGPSFTEQDEATFSGITANTFVVIGPFSVTQAYEVLVEVFDDFTTSAIVIAVPVAEVFMHWKSTVGVGFGKYWERGRIDVAGDIALSGFILSDRVPTGGTEAERDDFYGVPTTDSQRVALANRQVRWFNTDMGWEESYYALTGLTGLTVPGLMTGTASGWYPVTTGPRAVVRMTGPQAQTNGQQITLWSFTPVEAYRRGGPSWFEQFDSNKTLRVKKAGRYRLDCIMTFPNGSGTGVCSWRGNIPTGILQYPVPLLAGYGQNIHHAEMDLPLPVDGGVYFQTDAASWTIGGPNAYMSLTYLGPRLVTD